MLNEALQIPAIQDISCFTVKVLQKLLHRPPSFSRELFRDMIKFKAILAVESTSDEIKSSPEKSYTFKTICCIELHKHQRAKCPCATVTLQETQCKVKQINSSCSNFSAAWHTSKTPQVLISNPDKSVYFQTSLFFTPQIRSRLCVNNSKAQEMCYLYAQWWKLWLTVYLYMNNNSMHAAQLPVFFHIAIYFA